MNIPPSTEPTSLCVGSSKNLCAGWLCVFEGTEDECKQYFQDNKVPDEYDHVFMMNCYRETVLRTFLATNNTGGTH
jgi:GTP-sensing pleiotropic transcriptional regulator CodY